MSAAEQQQEATQQPVKPAPQILGVEGVAPKPVELTPAQQPAGINWFLVAALPPFQMYVHEQAPCPPERNQQQWAIDYAVRYASQQGDQAVWDAYAAWHEAKGYWPAETPDGRLRGAE